MNRPQPYPLAELSRAYGGGRVSSQRRAIASAIEEAPGAFTVDELSASLRGRAGERAGTATVYRAVASLEASGWLERVGERSGSALFARCSAGGHHHHHLVCEQCGRTEPTACPVLPQVQTGATAGGFVVTRHEVTLYGLCAECSTRSPEGGGQ